MTDQSSQDKNLRGNSARQTKRTSKPKVLSETDLIRQVVEPKILHADWHSNGIIHQPKLAFQGLRLIPDFVLLHEWYPLAVIEVKSPERFSESGALEQAKYYAETVRLPLAIATDGTNCVGLNLENGQQQTWGKFPSPQDLWQWLGRPLDSTDPRLYPVVSSSLQPLLHQALALGRSLDALVSGQKRGIVSMAAGSESTDVVMQLVHKLIHSGFYQRILYVSDHKDDLKFANDFLQKNRENSFIISQSKALDYSHQIQLATTDYLAESESILETSQESHSFYNLIITRNADSIDKLIDTIGYLSEVSILGFSTSKNRKSSHFPAQPIFEYSVEDAVVDITPPEGFRTILLGDITEINSGLTLNKSQYSISEDTGSLQPEQVYFLTARDILSDGAINFNGARRIQLQDLSEQKLSNKNTERYLANPGDILMPRISRMARNNVALVPDNEEKIVFADSVIRIRVDQAKAKPLDVVNFLKSDSGHKLVHRFSSSLVGMSRLSPSTLAKTPIFLPESDSARKVKELSDISMAVRQLKEETLPSLELLEKSSKLDNKENTSLKAIAFQLHQLADNLVPLPLTERILNKYPTPIALAYKRFEDSRFNVYEQVQRLQDVYEAASFFIYNLVLADCFHRLDPKKFFISNAGERRAYNSFAMAGRIDFIKSITDLAKPNNGTELFIPELVNMPFTEPANKLKNLRNSLSHTATATESGQRKIFEDSLPAVEALLDGLAFLEDYRMVRVPSFYRKNGKLTARMEVYQGTVPTLGEKEDSDDLPLSELIKAEHDHLIMLNSSGKILDIYPMYQLIENERTQYESHICFLKQRKKEDRKLEGESVQYSKDIPLKGFDEFEKLQRKILNEIPATN